MEKIVRPHISKEKNQQKMRKDAILKGIFRIAAVISGGAIAVIVLFVFLRGVQPFLPGYANGQVNFIDFLFGTTWRQDQGISWRWIHHHQYADHFIRRIDHFLPDQCADCTVHRQDRS